MRKFKLSSSGDRGWFIGDFDRAVHRTKDFEVNYKENPKGKEATHVHKIITEITLVLTGKLVVNGELCEPGDIYILDPGNISQIEYLEPSNTITIKTPSVPNDKHYL
jgi:hypothetical protein